MELKAETKKRWIEDLRSGNYEQCQWQMIKEKDGIRSFCCLGVLNYITTGGNIFNGNNSKEYSEFLDNDHHGATYLTWLNDGKNDKDPCSFAEIADYIEENVKEI